MADEFQAGVCGSGNWWNSSRSIFGLSPCASSMNDLHFAWPSSHDSLDMKITSNNNKCSDHESGTSDDSVVLQELPKHHHQIHDSVINNNNNTASLSMDSTLEMLGIGLSSSSSSTTPDWNHTFLHGNERSDTSYNPSMLQEDLNSSLNNYHQETGVDCSEVLGKNNFSNIINQDSSTNSFKPMNQDFTLGQHQITSSTTMNSSTSSSSSFSYPSSALLQTLFDNDPPQQQQQQHQQSSFIHNQTMNFPPSSVQYRPNLNDFSPSFPKFPSLLKPKQTPSSSHSSFSNAATSLWNTSASTSLLPSKHYQFMMPTFNEKSSTLPNLTAKSNAEEIRESSSSSLAKKNNNEPAFKRPRMETPSPLPTFKVRKEKLGDRITALQQLVSPFGKTDTASVLHEAIEYIRFLHDQVNVLSTPYMKNGSPSQRHQGNEEEVSKQDLRSRGLCLVPISSTFPVAAETSTDFWTPTFGGTFR